MASLTTWDGRDVVIVVMMWLLSSW
jgi:hypothetical protein